MIYYVGDLVHFEDGLIYGLSVRSIGGEGIVGICYSNYPRLKGDIISFQSLWVAATIKEFMMLTLGKVGTPGAVQVIQTHDSTGSPRTEVNSH